MVVYGAKKGDKTLAMSAKHTSVARNERGMIRLEVEDWNSYTIWNIQIISSIHVLQCICNICI